jgi:triacylglycerol lipase
MLEHLTQRAESLARRAVELVPFPQPALSPTRYPVVLMHGFGAVANLMKGGVLHREAMHLRGHGVWAYAPHVNPYDTIDTRAAAWADRIDRVLEETGAAKVNLVGFSLGGLDARYLIGTLGRAEQVASLVTVSAPHRGSSVMEAVFAQSDRLRGWAVAFMDFVGRAAYEHEAPHVEDALHEMTPDYVCRTFNPAHPDHPGVYYASYAGCAGRGTGTPISPALIVPNRLLYEAEGVNDGLVAVASAKWGEFRGTLDADHGQQVGFRFAPGPFDSKGFFLEVAQDLAERGF